jgi:hypothetical protein
MMNEEQVTKKHHKNETQDKKLSNRITAIKQVIDGIQSNSEIMLILMQHGYPNLDEGIALQDAAFSAYVARQQALAEQLGATIGAGQANGAAREAYGDFRKMARIVFKDDATRLALNLNGRVSADRARFMRVARAGYDAALTDTYGPALAQRGFPRPVIEAGSALLDALTAAEEAQTAARAAALQATANRTAAMRCLDDWFIQFRDIAKIALRDHIEWLPLLKIR